MRLTFFSLVLRSCSAASQPQPHLSCTGTRSSQKYVYAISCTVVSDGLPTSVYRDDISVVLHICKDERPLVISGCLVSSLAAASNKRYLRVVRHGIYTCARRRQRLHVPCTVTSRLSCTCETPDTAMRNHSSSSYLPTRTCISSHSHSLIF
jgi:hypothetical protein